MHNLILLGRFVYQFHNFVGTAEADVCTNLYGFIRMYSTTLTTVTNFLIVCGSLNIKRE